VLSKARATVSGYVVDVNRSASDSIRGYFSQLTRTALRWTQLADNEELIVEGDEDYDRLTTHADATVSVDLFQHKDTKSELLSWNQKTKKSLVNFAVTCARRPEVNAKYCYVTTSDFAPRDNRLKRWLSLTPAEKATVLKQIRKKAKSDAEKEAVAKLDAAWLSRITWVTNTPDHSKDLVAISEWCRPLQLPNPDHVAAYLVHQVIKVATQAKKEDRALTKAKLDACQNRSHRVGGERTGAEVRVRVRPCALANGVVTFDRGSHRPEHNRRQGH
jgi:hypothetical protein